MEIGKGDSSLLSDIEILERLIGDVPDGIFVSPLVNPAVQIGPSSLDLHLGTEVGLARTTNTTHIDLTGSRDDLKNVMALHFFKERMEPSGAFVLHPGEFTLGATLEFFRLPLDIAGRLEGRSSFGRLGLQVHATAGFVDPGFEGVLTFEFTNVGKLPLKICPGIRIGQICFFKVGPVQVGYMDKALSKYGRKVGVEFSQIAREVHENS